MGWQRCDGDGRLATRRMLASAAPPIQGINQLMWSVWGGEDKREGEFGGIEPQKRVEVELIEWRSLHIHTTNSKSSFCPSQSRKSTGTYSACILGVRLHCRRHGKHVYWLWKKGRLGVSCSVSLEGGFGQRNFYLDFSSVLLKIT